MVTFNPDTVLLSEQTEGVVPGHNTELIVKDVMANSKIMQLAQFENMTDASGRPVKEKSFTYLAEGPGAYWVDEGERIQTDKAVWLDAKMKAHKLGIILPVSKEFLTYNVTDFFDQMRNEVQKAFYRKFDAAAIADKDNPFKQSIEGSVQKTGQIVDGDINLDTFFELDDLLADEDVDVNSFISTSGNRNVLRNLTNPAEGAGVDYDRNASLLDGYPVVNVGKDIVPRGTLYALDADHLHYGIPQQIEYEILREATLSTVTDAEGNPINLAERDLMALKATMHVAFMVSKDEAFAKIEPIAVP